MKNAILVGALIFSILSILPAAANAAHDSEYCNQNQMQGNECAIERADAADKELNRLYKEILSRQDDEQKKQLLEAQRAWVAYKEKECKWEADQYKGGSISPMMYSACLERLTNERNSYFKMLADQ